ncbi:MAG TPA: CDP-alcohol phosphatidyltransferase family protein [Vicinamibacterales bacterium]
MLRFYTMPNDTAKPSRIGASPGHRRRAWLVHMYTATGAVLAFVGAWAVVHGNDRLALGSMFAATIVDATDGALARRARVKDVLPDVDGARIDDIVDYLTFVFLPMLLLEASGGLFQWMALPVIAVVLLSSMYGFVAPDAKSSDYFFTGFPSYWNIVVLYLMLFHVPPFWNAVVLLALSALIFVRIGYVYPSRTPTLRTLTLLLGSAWAAVLAAIILLWPSPPAWLAIGSLAFPVYYTVLSFMLHARRRSVA